MRFKITRTSLWGKKPCDDAYSKLAKTWDFRTFASEAEHDARFPQQPWRAEGFDHQVVEGGIRRAHFREHWFIDLEDERGILRLVDAYGAIIIEPTRELDDTYTIEIYDDYRE